MRGGTPGNRIRVHAVDVQLSIVLNAQSVRTCSPQLSREPVDCGKGADCSETF
jgi:hypothetical protein